VPAVDTEVGQRNGASTISFRPGRRRGLTAATLDAERYVPLVDIVHQHGPASVRHFYYQAVVAQLLDITKDHSGYRKVQRAILKLRREQRIPYELVTDTTRWMRKPKTYSSVGGALAETAAAYRRDLWEHSRYRVEVWCESDSIASTIYPITELWRVPLMPCRGQSSETFAWAAAEAWRDDRTRVPVVLYIGDHDPAGLEIEASLNEKLSRFVLNTRITFEWRRLGVTWDQVEAFDLPGTTPKKPYGHPLAVEAEALAPQVLRDLVDDTIRSYADQRALEVLLAAEDSERDLLLKIAKREYVS
jgi:hypothetical protein